MTNPYQSHVPFIHAVLAAPKDDSPRLIYADWLDEHGESDRAEHIRLGIKLETYEHRTRERDAVRARMLQIESGSEWFYNLATHCGFYRGMAYSMSSPLPFFLQHAQRVFSTEPIDRVCIHSGRYIRAVRERRWRITELAIEIISSTTFSALWRAEAVLLHCLLAHGRKLAGLPNSELEEIIEHFQNRKTKNFSFQHKRLEEEQACDKQKT